MSLTVMNNQTPHWPYNSNPSLGGQFSDSAPTDAFLDFVRRHGKEYKGRDGHRNEKFYMPLKELSQYWTHARIRAAKESYSPNIYIRPVLIRDHYLRVFSILVYIGLLSYIPTFHQHGWSDEKFPVTSLSGLWGAPSHEDMAKNFQRYQWMFYPIILDRDALDNTILPPERILPLCAEHTLERGPTPASRLEAATISKVNFHPSCNNLCEHNDESTTPPTYILKTYYGEENERHYEHEIQAFTRLQNNPAIEHIVKCYATFRQADTYNLVMEYIPGGDLLQYFRTTSPPRNAEDRIQFWDSLTRLVTGLHHIHQVSIEGESSARYQLVHQDIKPDNILVDPGRGSGTYQFSPIIADLGHSHTRHINSSNRDVPAVDRRGNQIYCAPESIHHTGFRRTGPNHITSDADIFSSGAVFSDAAAWVAGGQAGRLEYRRLREQETDRIDGFTNSGYEGAFHDGSERLTCVDEQHRHIRNTVPSDDSITSRVLEIVEKYMMTPTNRMPANQLSGKFENELRRARDELMSTSSFCQATSTESEVLPILPRPSTDVQTPSPTCRPDRMSSPTPSASPSLSTDGYADDQDVYSPLDSQGPSTLPQTTLGSSQNILDSSGPMISNLTRPNGRLQRPLTTPVPPPSDLQDHQQASRDTLRSKSVTNSRLSMRDAKEHWINKKNQRRGNPDVDKVIDELISNLKGRDHFFLVDDTRSMEAHSLEIESSFQALAYIAKRIDPNNLELSFVSKPLEIFQGKHTTPLVRILKQHIGRYTAIEGSIETSLSALVNKKIMRRLPIHLPGMGEISIWRKPITIFIFTDGRWGNGIRRGNGLDVPIGKLMKEITARGLTRTQVLFQFLRFGNDEDGRNHLEHLDEFGKEENCDIVDYRDIDGDVWAMFLAAYTENNDRNNERKNDRNNDEQSAKEPVAFPVASDLDEPSTDSS